MVKEEKISFEALREEVQPTFSFMKQETFAILEFKVFFKAMVDLTFSQQQICSPAIFGPKFVALV